MIISTEIPNRYIDEDDQNIGEILDPGKYYRENKMIVAQLEDSETYGFNYGDYIYNIKPQDIYKKLFEKTRDIPHGVNYAFENTPTYY